MEMEELLHELEDLVDAIGQTMAIMSGTLAEAHGPDLVLRHILASKGVLESYHGPNEWRDRLIRDMVRIVAIKARPAGKADPTLQPLIASVLEGPVGRFQKN